MAIDRWFIGGGAEHTPESARRLVYASTGGAEGVGGVNDLKVLPLAVPGAGVRVVVGSGLIKSRYVGGETQTYMGTVYEQETVSIAPTGSGSARSDLIVLRVEDPFAAGSPWDTPTPIETSPYIHIRVISGVPANTKRLQDVPGHANDTALTLARIDLPPSTGTVTAAQIHDLRKVALPKVQRDLRTYALTAGDTQRLTVNTAYPLGGQTWPVGSIDPTPPWAEFNIPEWATRARVRAYWAGVKVVNNNWGDVWVEIAPLSNPNRVFTQSTAWNSPANNWESRLFISNFDDIAIPAGLRGTTQRVYPRGRRHSGVAGSYIELDWASAISLEIEWYEGA